ncbi:M24 family metallopeptidase [Thermodesulfobacteriota bacterium]
MEPVFFSGGSPSARTPNARGWVNDIRGERNPHKPLEEEVARFKTSGGIGLVQIDTIPIPFYLDLVKKFGTEAIRDATDIFKNARLVKSKEEIECCRKSAKVANDVYLHLKNIVRAGLTDWEIYGDVRRLIHEGHCEYSMELINCGESDGSYAPIGSVLAEGGRIGIEITPAYEGYYSQLRVDVPVSPPSASRRKLFEVWEKGYVAAIEALRPGSKACDVYHAVDNAIQSKGLTPGGRAGHSIGLDVDEFLSLDPQDETVIEPGMTIVIHPTVLGKDGERMMLGGTFMVTKNGQEALNDVDFF